MAYTKTLIGDITEKGFNNSNTVKLQELAVVVDANLTDIETAIGADTVLGFGSSEPPAVGTSTSGTAGDATTAARSNHSHDLSPHAHTDATDGGALTDYQADLTASSTLADLGVATIEPAFTGVLSGITTASTLAQLLAAIDSHTHT